MNTFSEHSPPVGHSVFNNLIATELLDLISICFFLFICVHVHDVYVICYSSAGYISGKSWKPSVFSYRMLDISDGIEDIGSVKWQLALCLLLCWIIVFVCLAKGIKSQGKVRVLLSVPCRDKFLNRSRWFTRSSP